MKFGGEYVFLSFRNAKFQSRMLFALLLLLGYEIVAWSHDFAHPGDITHLMQNNLNWSVFSFAHKLMSSSLVIALTFKLIYYFGYPATIILTALYLPLVRNFKRMDMLLLSFFFAYCIAFPVFFMYVANEPVVVNWGYLQDMTLYAGQDLESTNFMTKTTFCIPSGHVFLSTICALCMIGTKGKLKYFIIPMALLVPLSTLMLSQHWVEDVVTGYATAAVAFLLAARSRPRFAQRADSIAKELDKIVFFKDKPKTAS